MKTTQLILLSLFFLSVTFTSNAQWQLAGNANSTSTSFIGTTAANPAAGQDLTFRRAGIISGKLQSTTTSFGVNSFATPSSVSIGVSAGQFSSGIGFNTYIGQSAGRGFSTTILNSGNNNTFVGAFAGGSNTLGNGNTILGSQTSTYGNSSDNTLIGSYAGINGNGSILIGKFAGKGSGGYGNNNIFIGNDTGYEDGDHGNNNIYIGHGAGFTEYGGNKLIIDNVGETYNAFIWGDMANDQLKFHAKVGISNSGLGNDTFGNFPTTAAGVNVSNYNLFVKGGILTEEVRVTLATQWADYVFDKNYKLMNLTDVEDFISNKGHLPNVPSAKEVKENGIELGEMAKIQQEKIEELTLYVIEQNKINQSQSKEIEEMKAQIQLLLNKK